LQPGFRASLILLATERPTNPEGGSDFLAALDRDASAALCPPYGACLGRTKSGLSDLVTKPSSALPVIAAIARLSIVSKSARRRVLRAMRTSCADS
jgi:hypothetical protein